MSTPFPLPFHLVSLVLQYLVPPVPPIPPHLLSKALDQRHLFLSVDLTDPASYFCWPRPNSTHTPEQILQSLESLSASEPESFVNEIKYDTDGEFIHARAQVGTLALVVFVWEEDGWKYHDLQTLPFPSQARASLGEVMEELTLREHAESHVEEADPADNYWDGYGSSSSSPRAVPTVAISPSPSAFEEDSYWAAYSSVQGTADSTIPSPIIPKRAMAPLGGDLSGPEYDGRLLYFPMEQEGQAGESYLTPFQLDEPKAGVVSHLAGDEPRTDAAVDPPVRIVINGSELDPPDTSPQPPSPLSVTLDGQKAYFTPSDYLASHPKRDAEEDESENTDMQDAIRGVYKLWVNVRRRRVMEFEGLDAEKAAFLELVRAAIQKV
ncbi:hypothetical protein BOTBODRAFT_176046 [Botryobasidium botryosum FD-172 SS1]|uniref:F-box domain-containing protein n=1 Tax=Botryobasidium botryosum (strain FD-172 SS1) TaxID=930990 RepID=A0A067MBH9_BOTB1|nr:hypothetical protein BOTBODRAFT_176046 [Botryobasidium botryosum FD-172 SS1]